MQIKPIFFNHSKFWVHLSTGLENLKLMKYYGTKNEVLDDTRANSY